MSAVCECGCGQATRISQWTDRSKGWTKGEPRRFALGHTSLVGKGRTSPKNYLKKKRNGVSRPVHVLIAEQALGRPLPAGVQVHHVDGNRRNNSPINLVICQDAAYHKLLHVRQRVIAHGGNPDTQRICGTCKKPVFISDLVGGVARVSNHCRSCHRQSKQAMPRLEQEP